MSSGPTDAQIIASIPATLPIGIWVARAPGGEFVYANERFQEIMGIGGRDDVAVGEYAEPYGIHDRNGRLYPEERMPFVQALQQGRTVMVDDIVIHRHDGERAYIRAYARPVEHEGAVSHVIIAFIDITREVQAEIQKGESESRMRQVQRLEAVGTLAGGIAHDFNNLLGAIRIVATTLAQSETDGERRASLDAIEAATMSAQELTRSLLGFAGEVSGEGYEPLQVDNVVRNVAQLLSRALDARYSLELELGEPPAVLGDAPRLEQVLMNLLINARDAMVDGGTIRIRTGSDDNLVRLHVQDEGPGIPHDLRERVFEPYFSTRTATDGRGVGLGLATVYGIVTAHGGSIRIVDSDRGAHFVIALPLANLPATDDRPRTPDPAPSLAPAHILVVDDEDLVRNAASAALRSLGYSVTAAASGRDAIAAVTARPKGFDGVLLDLAMPDLDGRATFEALRELDPDIRVILTSGYALSAEATALIELGVHGFLDKPYGLSDLSHAIEELLHP